MIDQTILLLMQKGCANVKLLPFAQELGMCIFFDQEIHFALPLDKTFNKVIRFNVAEAYVEIGVIQTNRRIIEIVKEHSPKYVLWPTMTYEILEETFQEIRNLGAYVIGWFFDDECRFENYSRWWIPYMDYIFTVDKASVPIYRELGTTAYQVLVTCEPEDFKISPTNSSYEVSFVGSKNVADRDVLVNRLLKDGIAITAFGNGWGNGFVSDDEMAQIFRSSKINICFTKSYDGKGNQLKGKIFDITMNGGFLLCEYVNGIEDFFEVGKEIECFNTYDEALQKIAYYLDYENKRLEIAVAGRIRATHYLAQHILLKKVFAEIETETKFNTERLLTRFYVNQIPISIRKAHSDFHLRWARILKKEGLSKKNWQEEFKTAYRYVSRTNIFLQKLKTRRMLISLIKRAVRTLSIKSIFSYQFFFL